MITVLYSPAIAGHHKYSSQKKQKEAFKKAMNIPPMPAPDAESILEKAAKLGEEYHEWKEEQRAALLLFYKGYKIEKPIKRDPTLSELIKETEKITQEEFRKRRDPVAEEAIQAMKRNNKTVQYTAKDILQQEEEKLMKRKMAIQDGFKENDDCLRVMKSFSDIYSESPTPEESKERVEKYTGHFPKEEPLNRLQKAFDNKGKMDELRSQLKEETVSFTQEQYANMVKNVIEIERQRDEARAIAEKLICEQTEAALDECPNGDPLPWKK